MDEIADSTFGIDNQAMAILHFMQDTEPNFANYKNGFYTDVNFQTLPWYNGRERGIVISMSVSYQKHIHIAFFEHRNSDSIHCLKWETDKPYCNHPLEDPNIFEVAYSGNSKWDTSKSFLEGEIGKCADWIYGEFEDFYLAQKKSE